jgi:hypothetical protein
MLLDSQVAVVLQLYSIVENIHIVYVIYFLLSQ